MKGAEMQVPKHKSRVALIATIALVAGMFAVVTAVSPAAAGRQVERPHIARSVGTNTNGECDLSGFPIVTCPFEGTTSGTGTHMGRTTGTNAGTATLDFTQVCVGVNGAPGTPITAVADAVEVVANGDEMHSLSEASGCFVDFGVGTSYVGTVTILGGTGRFEGASGVLSTTQSLVADDQSGDTSFLVATSVGTITY